MTPPPLKQNRNVKVNPGDSLIILRADGSIEIRPHLESNKEVRFAALTAFGIYWALQNEEWRISMAKRAKRKLEDIIAGREELE